MKTMRERPIQIYLRPDQDKALRHLAQTENVSIAELVRRGVDKILTEMPPEQDPLLGLIGIGHSGIKDLSERHDYYLVEALKGKKWHPKPQRKRTWRKKSSSTRARGSR